MTYEFGDRTKPTIIVIHGFGGSALIFFRLYKVLNEKYHVILIDLIGDGCSSRPEFLARTKLEAEQFYVQAFEKWRAKMGLEVMNIVAHSFGAYVTSRYALKYPERVNKFIMWSPHGMETKPDNYPERLKKLKKTSCKLR
jgi:cardiolipin-specific phospholipase